MTNFKRFLTLFLVVILAVSAWAVSQSFAFSTIGTTGWSNSYNSHEVSCGTTATVYFTKTSKQTATITDIPVTKAGPITLVLTDGTQSISSITFTGRQWGTKTKTMILKYSTNGGSSYAAFSPAVQSTSFSVSTSSLPSGTNAVELSFSETDNQVGIESVSFTVSGGCSKKVNITNANLVNNTTNGSFTLDKKGEQASCDGDVTVNITMSPDAGYYASDVTAPNSSDITDNGDGTWKVTYAQNTNKSSEIGVTFSAIPKYTVTFNQGSGICTTPSLTETSAGDGVELPTASHGCVDWELAGWAESSVGTETTVKPTLYAAGSTYHPTSNVSLYAVYKRTEGGGSGLVQSFNFESIASAKSWVNGTAYTNVTLGDVTLTANGGGNNGKYYTSDKTWRIYSGGGSASVSVTGGEVTAVSSNPSRVFTITAGEATYTPSANTSFKSITVTYSSGTTYYHSTPSCTGLQVTPTSLDFGTKNISTNTNLTITVTGTELSADASLSITGANAGMFSVSPTTLLKNGSNEITGSNNVTVTYHPTVEGTHSATLTITSGSFTKTVTLSGSCALVCTTPTLTFGGTSSVSKVLGSGKFTIAASSPNNTLDAAITYSSSNTSKATVDENTGEVTLKEATGSGSPVTITATLAAKNTGVACQNEVTASYTLTIYNKVTWMVGEDEYTGGSPTTQTTQGGQITTFPSDPDGDALCGGKEFIGWTDHEVVDPVDVAPTPMYKLLSDLSSVYINANKTFYAVFAASSSGATPTLTQMREGDTFTAGDKIVIVAKYGSNNVALYQETTNTDYVQTWTFENNAATVAADDKNWLTVSTATGGWYLGDNTNGYIRNSGNNLYCDASKVVWTLVDKEDGTDCFRLLSGDRYLSYRSDLSTKKWRMGGTSYGTSGSCDLYVYKFTGSGTSYSDYSTTCGTCLSAPTAPTVTPKSNRATITWAAVPDATGYTVTCTGGVVDVVGTTATITGLASETSYDFTIRSQGSDPYTCFPAYHGSFTTTSCEDSPVLGIATVTTTSATLSWTCEAATATVRVYEDAECNTQVGTDHTLCTSPYTVTPLTSNTTYYYKVLAGGTCPSSIGSFTTEEIKLDIAEWQTDAVVVSFNGDANLTLTTLTEETHGDPHANVAEDIFFSKYFEAALNVKLLAIFNGTMSNVDLSNYKLGLAQSSDGISNTTTFTFTKFSDILKQGGEGLTADELLLKSNEELILISYTDGDDDEIIACAQNDEEHSKYSTYIRIATPKLQFNGDDVVSLLDPDGNMIDLIGAGTKAGGSDRSGASFIYRSSGTDYNGFMDRPGGWYTTHGYRANTDNTETADYALSSNRCLLIRRKHVKSGHDAVARNATDFVTLGDYTYMGTDYEGEWKGVQIPGSTTVYPYAAIDNSCDGFAVVGGYNYNDYYVDFEISGTPTTFEDLKSDPFDGTYEIPVTGLNDKACTFVRIELKDGSDNLVIRKDVKVPIMISGNQNTTADIFHSHYKDEDICRACDVVILGNGTLTKVTDGTTGDINEVRDLKIYPGGKLVVPTSTNYTVNSLAFRRQEDAISSADIRGNLTVNETDAVYLDVRIDPTNWHYFTLPYDCNVSDITFSTGDPATLGTDYLLQWYDGAYRAAHKTGGWTDVSPSATLKKGLGYIIALPGSGIVKKELRFPMANDVIADESTNKTVTGVYGYGADNAELRPNHKGWNLLGNPYFMKYSSDIDAPLRTGLLLEDHSTDPWDGQWTENGDGIYYIVEPIDNGWSGYRQVTMADYAMKPFTCYFVQIGAESPLTPSSEQSVGFDYAQTGRPALSPAPRRFDGEEEDNHPVWVGITMTAPNHEIDKTALRISNKFTDGYDMMNDLVKMRGSYYTYYNKPVLASRNSSEELAFNALPDASAEAGVPLNYYAATDGSYTIALDSKYPTDEVKSAMLLDAMTNEYNDLMAGAYTFVAAKGDNTTRFKLFVRVERKNPQTPTGLENIGYSETPRKILIDGHVYIQRGNALYDVTGKQMLNR